MDVIAQPASIARAASAAAIAVAAAGCAMRAPAQPPAPAQPERIAIVASERWSAGVRLVAIDESGDRRFELVKPASASQRDSHPAVSPDGRWIVFASTRDRAGGTSLWIAPLAVEATARRLTDGAAIDSHPVWTPDGRAIVFASTRDGGDFDLWQLALAGGRPAAAPVQLTDGAGHEVTPSVASDGAIVYAVVTPTGEREVHSHLAERAADGTTRALTGGPADSSPAVSPDGATIVFARPFVRDGAADGELWRMARGAPAATRLVDLPLTDESGPVWSRDGRFVFATSVLRGERGDALFSSVVHVDLHERWPLARLLEDRAGANVRLTPAIPIDQLDVTALHSDPEYLPELARIMAAAIANRTRQ